MTFANWTVGRRRNPDRFFISSLCAGFLVTGALLASSGAAAQTAPGEAIRFPSDRGEIIVSQVMQMSVVITTPSGVIYTDPTQGKARYAGHPKPDVILVSHEHHEHFDTDALEEIAGPKTRIVAPHYVTDRLPAALKERAVSLANGETTVLGSITVKTIPAYGLKGQSKHWHPFGRGNGYVVTADGRRIYIAGSTDATPEMLRLQDIEIALLPLYPPYALGVDDAVKAVAAFKPRFTYVYQYDSVRTRNEFVRKMRSSPSAATVIAPDIDS